eukprot:CAMPEP_0117423674 /NCGR_PEP_ID=MMETSP0758-20121206/4238_1 /TAXON_ID=63605 /ORGANISM="Percolomonas cosmopolitus, Strain AE-1 (ATCC 50343)" /LENGTH=87 /DNA_ID=CAMNT_0005206979 /DNA_START=248 /DNA_END=508 /DNA_ORIENTATION=-
MINIDTLINDQQVDNEELAILLNQLNILIPKPPKTPKEKRAPRPEMTVTAPDGKPPKTPKEKRAPRPEMTVTAPDGKPPKTPKEKRA